MARALDIELMVSFRRFITVRSVDEIPRFRTEQEEREFWDTHDFSEDLLDQTQPDPDDPRPPSAQRPTG